MSSREIAELTRKDIAHVHRDIRAMLEQLADDPELDHVKEDKDARGYTSCFHLTKNLSVTLVAGYNVKLRKAIIDRWQELEAMSSREIADLVELRHDNVKRTIETLGSRGVITLPQIEEVQNAGPGPKTVGIYQLKKRDSLVVVAQLSPEFTARLVDRWQEPSHRESSPTTATRTPSTCWSAAQSHSRRWRKSPIRAWAVPASSPST